MRVQMHTHYTVTDHICVQFIEDMRASEDTIVLGVYAEMNPNERDLLADMYHVVALEVYYRLAREREFKFSFVWSLPSDTKSVNKLHHVLQTMGESTQFITTLIIVDSNGYTTRKKNEKIQFAQEMKESVETELSSLMYFAPILQPPNQFDTLVEIDESDDISPVSYRIHTGCLDHFEELGSDTFFTQMSRLVSGEKHPLPRNRHEKT
eukprot:234536_1